MNLSSIQHQLSHLVDNSSTHLIEGSYRRYSKMEHTGVLHVIIGVARGVHDATFHYCTSTYYMRLEAGLQYNTSLFPTLTVFRCRFLLPSQRLPRRHFFERPSTSRPYHRDDIFSTNYSIGLEDKQHRLPQTGGNPPFPSPENHRTIVTDFREPWRASRTPLVWGLTSRSSSRAASP
jgi:hypothetical protein